MVSSRGGGCGRSVTTKSRRMPRARMELSAAEGNHGAEHRHNRQCKKPAECGRSGLQKYQDELSRIPAFNVLIGGKALTVLDEKMISLELTDNRGFNADELTITVDDSQGDIELPPRGAELSLSLGWQGSR